MMTTRRKAIAAVLAVMLAAAADSVSARYLAGANPGEQSEQAAKVRASADVKDSLSTAAFPKLHALIRPRPGGFDEVPWLTSLWQARKKAAAEGKPILLWVGDGHPLGWTWGSSCGSRAGFLRGEKELQLVKDNFVPIAVDMRPMFHRQDAEGEFFRLVRKQAPSGAGFAGASGGEYVITASGKMLSRARVGNIVKGLEEFNKLPEADRKPGRPTSPTSATSAYIGEMGKIDPKWPVPTPGGLIVRVYQTRLERDADDNLRQPAKFRSFGWGCYEPGRDTLWLTEAECKSLVPADLKTGKQLRFPAALGDRLARSALRDLSETNGVTWDPNAVRFLKWMLTVEDVSASRVRLCLKGGVSLRNDPVPAVVECTKALAKRSLAGERFQAPPNEEDLPAPRFDARVLGYLDYDRAKQAFTRFDVAALGDYVGIHVNPDYQKPRQPYYFVIKPMPVGIAFEIAPPGQVVLPHVRWRELYSGL